jgi:hypothetical protein
LIRQDHFLAVLKLNLSELTEEKPRLSSSGTANTRLAAEIQFEYSAKYSE